MAICHNKTPDSGFAIRVHKVHRHSEIGEKIIKNKLNLTIEKGTDCKS